MPYPKGTKVTFTVTGEADGRGIIRVGCKSATEDEIAQYGNSVTVVEPEKPGYRDGDVLTMVNGVGRELRRHRRGGRWYSPTSAISSNDSWYLDPGNRERYRIKDLVRGGELQAVA